jgi:cyclophilin family peptidyl-prolyl cis-trans isomerase
VVPGLAAQGGDVIFGDGSGSECVFGTDTDTFEDERLDIPSYAQGPGAIYMVNRGKDSNGSQFFASLGQVTTV